MSSTTNTCIARLEDRGFIEFRGPDAAEFLQGYLTTDIEGATPFEASLSAVCDVKGRVFASFLVAPLGATHVLFCVPADSVDPLLDFLGKYAAFARSTLADVSDDWAAFGLQGDDDAATADGDVIARLPDGLAEIYLPADQASARCDAWQAHGIELAACDWPRRLLAAGICLVDTGHSGKWLPQQFNYDELDAVNFRKGCYLGQEIVLRAQKRGAVKRRLTALAGALETAAGTALHRDGRRDGEVIADDGSRLWAVVSAGAADESWETPDGRLAYRKSGPAAGET